jgi:DmsE family decaheme c-type cytochrome
MLNQEKIATNSNANYLIQSSFWLRLALLFSICFLYLYSNALMAADESCKMCHAQLSLSHQSTPHGYAEVSCDSCHGDGASHLKAPNSSNITSFSTSSASSNEPYKVCSNCHKSSHSIQNNAHSAAGVTCGNCHSTHATEDEQNKTLDLPNHLSRLTPGSSMCYECHQDSFSQFEFNERHRLAEGVVECTSCHDPHQPEIGMQLGGFKQSVCSDCHADLTGPFVHEHAASHIDGCAACHEPHGSPNRHMLKIQQVGALCYSCHADAPQFHIGFSPSAPPRFDENTVCTNCHVSIHGSNLDADFLR